MDRWTKIGHVGGVLPLLAVALLTACGTSGVAVPREGDPLRDLVGTHPTAVALFAGEAEEATFHQSHGFQGAPFKLGMDDRASRGGYLVQPSTIADSRSGEAVAQIAFDVDEAGEYALWVRLFAPSLSSDATYVGFNGSTQRVFAPETGKFLWLETTRARLTEGRNVISLGHGEPGLRIDLFAVVRRPDVGAHDLDRLVVSGDHSGMQPTPVPGDPGGRIAPSLRGDPSFDAATLSAEAAIWYERILESVEDGSALRLAGRDCVYHYGRTLNAYVQTVLLVFRLTGDLALLDHVDEIGERMRSELRDGWRGTTDGTDGTKDGYLNWVFRYDGDAFKGKDTSIGNEMRTHALVASIAHALDVNRDLVSPGGRAYGKHADQWRDYLVNHFEAKWRERTGRATVFPFMLRPHTHTYYSWMRWHHYMGQLTGESGYRIEAERMATVLSEEVREVSTPTGTAYVWPRSVLAEGGSADYLHPTTYARYVYGDVIEMHLEAFDWYASTAVMERFARTFTEFVMDKPNPVRDGFSGDIGGGVARGGLWSDDWGRLSAAKYQISSYAMIGPWDGTGRMTDATKAIYEARGDEDGLPLAAGAFFAVWFVEAGGVNTVVNAY